MASFYLVEKTGSRFKTLRQQCSNECIFAETNRGDCYSNASSSHCCTWRRVGRRVALQLTGYGPNLVARAVATVMSCLGNFARPSLAPLPNVRQMCSVTEAVERVLFGRTSTCAYQKCSIAIRGEGNQIAGAAFRTLHAMANADRHSLKTVASGLPWRHKRHRFMRRVTT